MAQDTLTLDENSFARIANELSQLAPALQEQYDKAVVDITALSGEWNDEDYQQLVVALKSFVTKIDELQETNRQLVATANRKIEWIQARCNIEM